MTKTHQNRIIDAINECSRFIDKEEKHSPALRPTETQKLLDFYYSHRAKLQQILAA